MEAGRAVIRSMRLLLLSTILVAPMVLPAASPAAAQPEDGAAQARPWVDSRPAVVRLRGFLVEKRYYGAPGHGETPKEDKKTSGWILLLETPINKRANEEAGEEEILDIQQVQLVVFSEMKHLHKKLRKLLGQEVYATGMLYDGNTGWYWSLNAMELQDVSLVPRDRRSNVD